MRNDTNSGTPFGRSVVPAYHGLSKAKSRKAGRKIIWVLIVATFGSTVGGLV